MAASFKKPGIYITQPYILYFKNHFKRENGKDFLGLTTFKYLFKLALN